jgi:adenylate cyclase
MSGTNTQIKLDGKTGSFGRKLPGFILLIYIFSVVLILTAAGKLLYDKTLENAETENVYINRQAAAALDLFFHGLQSASTALLDTVSGSVPAVKQGNDDFFFESNRHVAALAFYDSPDRNVPPLTFTNHAFFNNNNLDARLVNIFIELNKVAPEGAGRTHSAVLNCETIFGFPLMAMVFPYRRGGTAIVFFGLTALEGFFMTGPHTGRMINTAGDVLLYSGPPPRPGGENVLSRPFIRTMLSGQLNSGRLRYVNGEGLCALGAYSKLNVVPVMLITEITYGAVFGGLIVVALRVGCIAAVLVFFLVLVVLFCTRSIRASLKKLTELDELRRKFETASRFADMRLVRQSLDGVLPVGAEYRNVTMLLSGIESFTRIAERLNPDQALSLLNRYISLAAGCISKTDGTLDRFSDGNVRAYWGALSSTGKAAHDALNCIRCALMLRVAVYELNRELSESGTSIKLSCGISSGEFTAGIADCGEQAAYTLIGEGSVLADMAKAQNMAINTDILITENTWRLVQKYVLVHEIRPLQIEGMKKTLRMFALINLKTRGGEAQMFPATLNDVQRLYLPEQPAGKPESTDAEYGVPEI